MASGEQNKDLLLLYRNLDWQYQLSKYEDEALKSIQKTLDNARLELFDEIRSRDIIISKGREDKILENLNDLTLGIQTQLTGNIHDAASTAGALSFQEYDKILSFDGALAKTVGFNFTAIAPEQIRSMVLTTPVGGRILEQWVADSFETRLSDQIRDAVTTGMLKGEDVAKTIKRVDMALGVARDKHSIARDAEAITRTFIASINNTAADTVYKANPDVIDRVKWNAAFEVSRGRGRGTCMECAALHGKEFALDDDSIRPPKHVLCRCFVIPVTKSYRERGLDINELKDGLKPYSERDVNRHILDAGRITDNFDTFLKSRDKEYQINFLGPNRYKMWKSGEISVKDLVDKNGNLRLLKKKDGKYTGLIGTTAKPLPQKTTVKPPQTSIEKSLLNAEKEIYSRKTEKAYIFSPTGEEILSKSGKKHSVAFTKDEVSTMKGGILTHNHPSRGDSFSRSDITLCINADMKEIRAVGPEFIHRVSPTSVMPEKKQALGDIKKSYDKADIKKTSEIMSKIDSGKITIEFANKHYYHEVWKEVNKEIPWLNYRREKWNPLK